MRGVHGTPLQQPFRDAIVAKGHFLIQNIPPVVLLVAIAFAVWNVVPLDIIIPPCCIMLVTSVEEVSLVNRSKGSN